MASYPETKVVIEGHTDSVGSAAYNQKLSQKRADSVRDYLIQNFNISPDRLTAKGYGEESPVTTNETEEGRRKNRRIQAVITVPPPPPLTVPEPPEKKAEEEKEPEAAAVEEKAPKPKKPVSAKKAEAGRFSIGIKTGPYFASSVGGFEISRINGASTEIWKFNDSYMSIGLDFSYQLTKRFSIDGSYERAFFTNLDLSQFALGSSYNLNPAGEISPYLRGSLIYGSLSWSDAPGDFDNGFGWQLGFGATKRVFPKVEVGLEAYYQGIGYDYNAPSASGVTATDSKVDFSGFAIIGTVAYCF
jgi:opacity protein-like surface antigen